MGLRISNCGCELRWSYGDSNPRPLACHPAATRPHTCISAGHRPPASTRVHPRPGLLQYFPAVRPPPPPPGPAHPAPHYQPRVAPSRTWASALRSPAVTPPITHLPLSGCRVEMAAWLPDRSRRGDGAVAET